MALTKVSISCVLSTISIEYVNLSKVEKHEIVLSRITELIVSIIKDRDLKEYIWTTYTNISEEDKKSVYKEALGLVDKKENFIKETVYSKLSDIVVDYEDIKDDYDFINTIKLVFENKITICQDCNICNLYKKNITTSNK